MERRSVLAGIGTVALAGCLFADDRPSEIASWTPETGIDTDLDADDDPRIDADREAATVTVEGRASYPAECGFLEIPSPGYDAERSWLTVEVDAGKAETDCGDGTESEGYRVIVRFDEHVPAGVVARELHDSVETTTEFD